MKFKRQKNVRINTEKLVAARERAGITRAEMARIVGVSVDPYRKKELGQLEFNRDQLLTVVSTLKLTARETNEIFFDNQLPIAQDSIALSVEEELIVENCPFLRSNCTKRESC